MSCERYADALIEHALGEPAADALLVHLAGCEACRSSLDRDRQLMAAAEHDLRRALAPLPSGTFEARVRSSVEVLQPEPRGIWWPAAAATAIVATIVVVAVVGSRFAGSKPNAPQPVASTARVAEEPRTWQAAGQSAPPVAPTRNGVVHRTRSRQSEPVVLVPPEQAQAVDRLTALVRSGRLELQPPTDAPAAPSPLRVGLLSIEPLAIPALDVDGSVQSK